jgi:MFS transporter, DHA2 family, methylenomycin A resistance protein
MGLTMNHTNKALTLAAMSLGFGVVQLDVTIVNTALNTIGSAAGGGVSALQWVVNSYTIGFASLILTAGALGDRVGAKRVFMGGFVIFTLASAACALAPSLIILIAARAIQGLGAAILVPNSLSLLNHAYPNPAARGRAIGFWAAGASVALTAGPLAGGALIALAGWRAIFLVNIPIGLAGIFLTWRYASETPRNQNRQLDLPGQAAAILSLGLLTAAIIEGGKTGWNSSLVIAGLTGGVSLMALFVLHESRAAQPMLPLGLFAERRFSLASAIGVLANIAFYGLIFVLSLYFQELNGWTPFETGLAFAPMLGIVLPVNILAPRLSERIGQSTVMAIGAGIAGAGALALLPIAEGTSFWAMCVQLLALGGGLGLIVPPMTSMLLGSVDKGHSGIASGVLNSARQTGSVIGVALFGAFVADKNSFLAGAHLALIVSGLLLLGAAALALLGRGIRPAASPPRIESGASKRETAPLARAAQ